MQSLCKTLRVVGCRKAVSEIVYLQSSNVHSTTMCGSASLSDISRSQCSTGSFNGSLFRSLSHSPGKQVLLFNRSSLQPNSLQSHFNSPTRCMTTVPSKESLSPNGSAPVHDVAPRIKFKRLDKTAGHIMKILDKEAVEAARAQREVPDIKPGYIIQMKVEVPENKRRVSTLKGIVIARRNAGLNTTFRVRRQVAGIGVESVYPLYSPNIKEIKVLDKNKVRRAKLYYLRDRMNALKRQ